MRISDWSSDVCSSDLPHPGVGRRRGAGDGLVSLTADPGARWTDTGGAGQVGQGWRRSRLSRPSGPRRLCLRFEGRCFRGHDPAWSFSPVSGEGAAITGRSEEHTSELQSLLRISYAVFCLKKKTTNHNSIT